MAGKREELLVIGAGFGRTGTTSTKAALEQLGVGPCHHMKEVNAAQARVFRDAYLGKEVDWKALLENYGSTLDWPSCTFYKELMEVYPDAKVLLTVRPAEKWQRSMEGTIFAVHKLNDLLITKVANFLGGSAMSDMIQTIVWGGTFHNDLTNKERTMEIFEQHNQAVRDHVPADRLLEFQVTDGWEPLCKFLGVPVPDTPFPHLNDSAEFQRMFSIARTADTVLKALIVAAPFAAVFAARALFK